MRKNFKHFWDASSALSKVDNFDVLKGPGFFSKTPQMSNVFLKTKLQTKRTALGRKIFLRQLAINMYTVLYNECFAWVKWLLMTMKWFLCEICQEKSATNVKKQIGFLKCFWLLYPGPDFV